MIRNIFIFVFFIFVIQTAFGLSIDEISREIKKQGANWVAGQNNIWALPPSVKKEMMGSPAPIEQDFTFFSVSPNKSIPGKIDWRDIDGVNFMSPITDQGRCGSCVAFAAIGTYEGQVNIANNWPGLNMNFSEQHLFNCGGGGCSRGWYSASAASVLKQTGVPDEACFPYTSGADGEDRVCKQSCTDSSSRMFKIKDYQSIGGWSGNEDDMKKALLQGPVLGTMRVYEDFMAYESGVYQHVTGDMLGGHAISIVGYNDAEHYWIVRNSWGPSWGEDGYFRIKMNDDSGVGSSGYSLKVDPLNGATHILKPFFGEVIRGNYNIELESTIANTEKLLLEMRLNGSTQTFEARMAKSIERYQIVLDTTKLADGAYNARLVAHYREGNQVKQRYSQYQNINILNSAPVVNVSIVEPKNGAELKDKVIVKFSVKGQPVPVTKLVFNIKNEQGEIKKVENNIPGPITLMSWKTINYPNGNYQIWPTGYVGDQKVEGPSIKVNVKN